MIRLELGIMLIAFSTFATSCKAQNEGAHNRQPSNQEQRKGPPPTDEVFKMMDSNKDGKLSKSEVNGPLANDFDKIDTNHDGFITKKELDKAPKPNRGQGPPPGER